MIYIEHRNPHQLPNIHRYDSIALAVSGVSRSTHLPVHEIDAAFKTGRPILRGHDTWHVVMPDEMCRRAGAFAKATQAMERGEDIDQNDIPLTK